MAVPKRRSIVKNRALRAYFQDMYKRKEINGQDKVEENDHKKRLNLLKDLGLLKENKNE
ncbi:MAG: hypothetical protein AABY07_01810 [Nanoarchaeota archaeon]